MQQPMPRLMQLLPSLACKVDWPVFMCSGQILRRQAVCSLLALSIADRWCRASLAPQSMLHQAHPAEPQWTAWRHLGSCSILHEQRSNRAASATSRLLAVEAVLCMPFITGLLPAMLTPCRAPSGEHTVGRLERRRHGGVLSRRPGAHAAQRHQRSHARGGAAGPASHLARCFRHCEPPSMPLSPHRETPIAH